MASPHSQTRSNPSTTPPTSASPPSASPSPQRNQHLDDIFDSSSPPRLLPSSTTSNTPHQSQHHSLTSELPALRRQHVTAGYREGLSLAKAKTVQEGFDDGYENGVGLGMRVGMVLGVLEGFSAAALKAKEGVVGESEEGKILDRFRREFGGMEAFLRHVDDEVLGKKGEVMWNEEAMERLRVWERTVLGKVEGGEKG